MRFMVFSATARRMKTETPRHDFTASMRILEETQGHAMTQRDKRITRIIVVVGFFLNLALIVFLSGLR